MSLFRKPRNIAMIVRAPLLASALIAVALAPCPARAQDAEASFLSDYSQLQPAPDNPFEEIYIAPDARQRARQYTAITVDPPELFIHPASKYHGIRPDDMKAIADALRDAVTAELEGAYRIVDAPGPNVLYVRLAVGDLMLEKRKPGARGNIASNVDLGDIKIEGEMLDGVSLEQFAAFAVSRGSLKVAPADETDSWDDLKSVFGLLGKRLRCRLDNAAASESDWQRCGHIGLATTTP